MILIYGKSLKGGGVESLAYSILCHSTARGLFTISNYLFCFFLYLFLTFFFVCYLFIFPNYIIIPHAAAAAAAAAEGRG